VLSLFLQERKLRGAPATSTGLEDGLAAPRSADSLTEIERSLTRVTTPEERMRFRERVAQRAGLELSPGATWALVRIREHGAERARSLATADGVPPERIAAVTQELRVLGLLTQDGSEPAPNGNRRAVLTATGREHAERLLEARRELLAEALADDGAVRDPQVLSLLRRLAVELCGEPPSVQEPAAVS
jgi:DNA-binding MarR family transcriptional regulator